MIFFTKNPNLKKKTSFFVGGGGEGGKGGATRVSAIFYKESPKIYIYIFSFVFL